MAGGLIGRHRSPGLRGGPRTRPMARVGAASFAFSVGSAMFETATSCSLDWRNRTVGADDYQVSGRLAGVRGGIHEHGVAGLDI
jgi:hypothetical protein